MRICSHPEDREKRFDELKSLLISRAYKPKSVDAAIEKARAIPREEALKKVIKIKHSNRPVFVVNFDPRLPSITGIIRKHWRTMTLDPRLAEIFPLPPLVAYKRPPNIKQKLIRAKIPVKTQRPKRNTKGMKKCLKCSACPYIKEGRKIEATQNKFKLDINVSADCQTTNCIYMLGCKQCPQQYIGETERSIKERFLEHKGYVSNKMLTKATGAHFNQRGHSISDMQITIIEKVFNPDPQFRKQRERMFINKFNTRYKGINRSSGG